MKKLLLASAAAALFAGAAGAEEVNMGISLGFTGPLESLAGPMDKGAQLAMKEVSDSGKLLDGSTVSVVTGDSMGQPRSSQSGSGRQSASQNARIEPRDSLTARARVA